MAPRAAYDYLIVGAGSAGCVLAARLSENPDVSVCVVEAGGPARDPAIADPAQWPFLGGADFDWNFHTVPQAGSAGRTHTWARGKVVGGSSCLHAMAHVRGHPTDFDRWVEAGCTGWGYADLLPYFIRSEHSAFADSPFHGTGGPISLLTPTDPSPLTRSFMAAAEECGHLPTAEHNGPSMVGPTVNTMTIKNGHRQSAADAYLLPVLDRNNLDLVTGVLARHLLFDDAGRCNGVSVVGADGADTTVYASQAVVLAAGAIGSPALLMHSGIGPAEDLRTLGLDVRLNLPGVGRNLHDHLLSGGNLYAAAKPVPRSRYQHSESLLYARLSDHAGAPDISIACVMLPAVTECFEAPAIGEGYTLMFGFTHPRSRGALTLTSTDPTVPPAIDPAYLSAPEDVATFSAALDMAREIGEAPALAAWRAAELLPGDNLHDDAARRVFMGQAAHTHHHPVGTCRMGTDAMAVVGPDLSVRGCEGLYVVDGSVMPSITTGPVHAAIIAIAERASDLIAGREVCAPITDVRPL